MSADRSPVRAVLVGGVALAVVALAAASLVLTTGGSSGMLVAGLVGGAVVGILAGRFVLALLRAEPGPPEHPAPVGEQARDADRQLSPRPGGPPGW